MLQKCKVQKLICRNQKRCLSTIDKYLSNFFMEKEQLNSDEKNKLIFDADQFISNQQNQFLTPLIFQGFLNLNPSVQSQQVYGFPIKNQMIELKQSLLQYQQIVVKYSQINSNNFFNAVHLAFILRNIFGVQNIKILTSEQQFGININEYIEKFKPKEEQSQLIINQNIIEDIEKIQTIIHSSWNNLDDSMQIVDARCQDDFINSNQKLFHPDFDNIPSSLNLPYNQLYCQKQNLIFGSKILAKTFLKHNIDAMRKTIIVCSHPYSHYSLLVHLAFLILGAQPEDLYIFNGNMQYLIHLSDQFMKTQINTERKVGYFFDKKQLNMGSFMKSNNQIFEDFIQKQSEQIKNQYQIQKSWEQEMSQLNEQQNLKQQKQIEELKKSLRDAQLSGLIESYDQSDWELKEEDIYFNSKQD